MQCAHGGGEAERGDSVGGSGCQGQTLSLLMRGECWGGGRDGDGGRIEETISVEVLFLRESCFVMISCCAASRGNPSVASGCSKD